VCGGVGADIEVRWASGMWGAAAEGVAGLGVRLGFGGWALGSGVCICIVDAYQADMGCCWAFIYRGRF